MNAPRRHSRSPVRPATAALAALVAVAAVAAGAATAPSALAQSKVGTTIGTFLMIEPSARIAGMGNAGAAQFEGLDAAYYNPAAIGHTTVHELEFSHLSWLAGIEYNHAAAALPAGQAGTLFATVTALNSGDIAVRTVNQPLGTGELYSVSDVAVGVGYGRRITDRFSAGAQVSYMQERIWHSTVSTFTLNLGTLYMVSEDGPRLGASLSNLGTQAGYDGRDLRITYDADPTRNGDNGSLPGEIFTDSYSVPILFRVGVGMPYRIDAANRLEFAIDAFHPSDNVESVSLGAEYRYKELFALRAGYQNLFLDESEVGLTFGAGIRGEMSNAFGFRFDYAYADQGRLQQTHRLTVGVDF